MGRILGEAEELEVVEWALPNRLFPLDKCRAHSMISKTWLVTAVAIVCMLLAGAFAVKMTERPWVEVLGDGVLRTNSSLQTVAVARDIVIKKHQNIIQNPDGSRGDPSYQGGGRSWKSGSSPERITAEVTRGTTQITDKDGHRLAIEQITATGAPMLVVITFDGAGGGQQIANELLGELQSRGVSLR